MILFDIMNLIFALKKQYKIRYMSMYGASTIHEMDYICTAYTRRGAHKKFLKNTARPADYHMAEIQRNFRRMKSSIERIG